MKKIGFIGMGNMASAIVAGLIKYQFVTSDAIIAYDRVKDKLEDMQNTYGICSGSSEIEVIQQADIILFAVKPNVIESVVSTLGKALEGKAVVSIVAGYDFEKYQALLPNTTRHLSIMPNTPLMVGQGMTLFEQQNSLSEEECNFVKAMFSSIGEVEVLPSHLMATGTAISGCGPAFMYMILEAIADGGVMEGLPREVAYRLASQTMIGSGYMQQKTKLHPGILKDNVCSPGGITIRGVQTLEKAGIRGAFIETIKNAK